MEQRKFSVKSLKECHDKGDCNRILNCLSKLKKHLRGVKNVSDVDRETLNILISFIKYPNSRIIDMSMSILANCCLKGGHRNMFKQLGGISPLLLILRTVDNDEILCRACRLLGNLASDPGLVAELRILGAESILLNMLGTIASRSSGTILMTLRAIQKLWVPGENDSRILPDDVSDNLNNCLNSTDDQLVTLSIKTLTLLSICKTAPRKNELKVSKELIANLVELSKREEMSDLTVNCLSNLICYQTCQVWKHLEGSNIAETFICYLQQRNSVNKGILKAFYKLCTEGAVRNKVKSAGVLPRLMKFCCDSNVDRILPIFYSFQFDESSIAVLAQDKEFVNLLVRNIAKNGAVNLLTVVSRLDPPIKQLLSEENLSVIIKYEKCYGILKHIMHTRTFLNQLIASGWIWKISEVYELDVHQDSYTEEVLDNLLRMGDVSEIENAALAVPFLVKPCHFTSRNLLRRKEVIDILLRLLKERTLEERILASIVKLIRIIRGNFFYCPMGLRFLLGQKLTSTLDTNREAFEDTRMEVVDCTCDKTEALAKCDGEPGPSDPETVTFELDCGSLVAVNKDLFCKSSPVMDAMLNGHFIESNQEKVKLSCCTRDALVHLEMLLKNKRCLANINVDTHLELISLTDRFLLPDLNSYLVTSLPVNESSFVSILLWCRRSGHTENNAVIQQSAYGFAFASAANLVLAMANDTLRSSLVNDISNYISLSVRDTKSSRTLNGGG